jgi:hypothetical protein
MNGCSHTPRHAAEAEGRRTLRVRVAYMRLDTLGSKALLQIQVESPVAQLSASLFAHDSVDVAWRAGFQLKSTDDPHVWTAGWKSDSELPPLLEIGNLTIGEPTWGPLDAGPTRWVFLKPESGDGAWISGEVAQAELSRIEQLREQRFTAPLVAPGASQSAPSFLVLAIADNLHITQSQRVPGISLTPITSALGDDVRAVLNRILFQRGFWQWLNKNKWLEQMQRDRPAVLIDCYVKAETPASAGAFSREMIKQLLDMITLRRGAAARLIAGVVARQNESGRYQVQDVWIEHSGYSENLLGGFLAGEDVHALQASWSGLQANPRAQLWVSLYADAVRDPRWDYQLFRCFNLLEAIADTVVQPNAVITDEAGNPRPFRRGNGSYTTKQAQGKVYMLLLHLAGTAADDQLWDEVGIWVQVRNDVAHEGAWQPPHAGETPEHAAARAAIAGSGRDGTFESGAQAIVKEIRESVKRALYAAIFGTS